MSPITKFKKYFFNTEEGSSLTEIAFMAPLLIFIFVGLFEVGYVLWGYITLQNVNREVARYSALADVLDYDTQDPNSIGYNNALSHTFVTNAGQLNLEEYFNNTAVSEDVNAPHAAAIITHIFVDTAVPCRDATTGPDKGKNCCDADPDSIVYYEADDFIANPDTEGYSKVLRYTYPPAETSVNAIESRLDIGALTDKLKEQNNRLNCELKSRGGSDFTDNSIIVVETFYDQPQLTGLFNVISTRNMGLYSQTTLRIDSNLEGRCEVIPIAAHIDTIRSIGVGAGGDLIQGDHEPGSNNIGWLSWNGESSATYLTDELTNARSSGNDYVNPADTADTTLNVDDWISSLPGVDNKSGVREAMDNLFGKTVMIPIYDNVAKVQGEGRYQVHSFAKVRIGEYSLPKNGEHSIEAVIIEWPVDGACPAE